MDPKERNEIGILRERKNLGRIFWIELLEETGRRHYIEKNPLSPSEPFWSPMSPFKHLGLIFEFVHQFCPFELQWALLSPSDPQWAVFSPPRVGALERTLIVTLRRSSEETSSHILSLTFLRSLSDSSKILHNFLTPVVPFPISIQKQI